MKRQGILKRRAILQKTTRGKSNVMWIRGWERRLREAE